MGVSSTECLDDWNKNGTYEQLKNNNEIPTMNSSIHDPNTLDADSESNARFTYDGRTPADINFSEHNSNARMPTRSEFQVRSAGSRKEKKRTECINNAFSELRKRIPNVPMDTKLSKIKTLRLATSYISYLTDIIKNSDPGDSRDGRDFRADLKALRTRERRRQLCQNDLEREVCTTRRKTAGGHMNQFSDGEIDTPVDKSITNKRRKGRTGWPEAVWAMELENKSTKNITPTSAIGKDEQNRQQDGPIYPHTYVFPHIEENRVSQPNQNLSDVTQAFYFLNNNGNYIQNSVPVYKYFPANTEVQNNGVCSIDSLSSEYRTTDEFIPHFSYPTIALPAASSFSRRLPPIPRLLHREDDVPFMPEISSAEFSTAPQLDDMSEFSGTTPSFAELKTVSVTNMKIPTLSNSHPLHTNGLQCSESLPVLRTNTFEKEHSL